MHYYLSFYFWDIEQNEVRRKLKEEFSRRYPWVILLEQSGKPGFVDYQMLNKFLSKINKETCESITLIDSDLVLQNNFKTLVEKNINQGANIIHGCSEAHELVNGKIMGKMKAISTDFDGFSGFIWSFSRRFLEAINWKFCDKFLLGGVDFIFSLLFIKKRPESVFKELLGTAYNSMLSDFYKQTLGFSAITLGHVVLHCWHGSRANPYRLTRFEEYANLTESRLKEIMTKRNSCTQICTSLNPSCPH